MPVGVILLCSLSWTNLSNQMLLLRWSITWCSETSTPTSALVSSWCFLHFLHWCPNCFQVPDKTLRFPQMCNCSFLVCLFCFFFFCPCVSKRKKVPKRGKKKQWGVSFLSRTRPRLMPLSCNCCRPSGQTGGGGLKRQVNLLLQFSPNTIRNLKSQMGHVVNGGFDADKRPCCWNEDMAGITHTIWSGLHSTSSTLRHACSRHPRAGWVRMCKACPTPTQSCNPTLIRLYCKLGPFATFTSVVSVWDDATEHLFYSHHISQLLTSTYTAYLTPSTQAHA